MTFTSKTELLQKLIWTYLQKVLVSQRNFFAFIFAVYFQHFVTFSSSSLFMHIIIMAFKPLAACFITLQGTNDSFYNRRVAQWQQSMSPRPCFILKHFRHHCSLRLSVLNILIYFHSELVRYNSMLQLTLKIIFRWIQKLQVSSHLMVIKNYLVELYESIKKLFTMPGQDPGQVLHGEKRNFYGLSKIIQIYFQL